MKQCCSDQELELENLPRRQKRVLKIVLAVNASMFVVEAIYGLRAHSTSLLADSLDMLGDALVYGFSLYVIGRSVRWKTGVTFLKGFIMALFGLGVIGEAIHRFLVPGLPVANIMGAVGFLALMANAFCAILLIRHRNDDINMQSVWLCSRNDVVANLSVLAAAGAVKLTNSKYPDLIVGIGIAALVLRSAFVVLTAAIPERKV